MKKILVSLLVLALCAPAMAATVVIADNANGTATITVTAEGTDNIVGLGLDIDVTGGNVTACTVDTLTFDIFPDAAHDMEVVTQNSYGYGDGTPIANQLIVGEAAISNSFCVSVGALNGEAIEGADGSAAVVITVTVDANANICVKENAKRGGIVLTTALGEDITSGTAGVVCGDVTVNECVKSTAPFYADWVAWGSPDCWCYQKNCNGDADGIVSGPFRVANPDLQILLPAFNKIDAMIPAGGICADFDHIKSGPFRVANPDLLAFLPYFNKLDALVPVCDMTNYNFWAN